jgi:hypothetical protein
VIFQLGVSAQRTEAVGLFVSIFLFVPHKKDFHYNPSRGMRFKDWSSYFDVISKFARGMQAKIILPASCKRLQRQPGSCCLFAGTRPNSF